MSAYVAHPLHTLLGVFVSGGQWLAVVPAFASKEGQPVIVKHVERSKLSAIQRRKFDRWIAWLDVPALAANESTTAVS